MNQINLYDPFSIVDNDIQQAWSISRIPRFNVIAGTRHVLRGQSNEMFQRLHDDVWLDTSYLMDRAVPTVEVDRFRIRQRLDDMKTMEDGWADGMQHPKNWGDGLGKAPSPEGLDWLAGQMEDHYRNDLPHPYLYPTTDGGVKIEWSMGPFEAGLRVDLSTKTGKWFCVNVDTDWVFERHLDPNNAIDWMWIVAELKWLRKEAT